MGFCHWASEHMCAVLPHSLNRRGSPSWAALCSFLRLLLMSCLSPRVSASEALRRAAGVRGFWAGSRDLFGWPVCPGLNQNKTSWSAPGTDPAYTYSGP